MNGFWFSLLILAGNLFTWYWRFKYPDGRIWWGRKGVSRACCYDGRDNNWKQRLAAAVIEPTSCRCTSYSLVEGQSTAVEFGCNSYTTTVLARFVTRVNQFQFIKPVFKTVRSSVQGYKLNDLMDIACYSHRDYRTPSHAGGYGHKVLSVQPAESRH